MRTWVLGAGGFVGSHLVHVLHEAGSEVVAVPRPLDLTADDAVERLFADGEPDAVVNLAAVPDIAPCRDDPAGADALNARFPGALAAACAARGLRLVHLSTDQVFSGDLSGPELAGPDGDRAPRDVPRDAWREGDPARPIHVYGETKLAGEGAVLAAHPDALVLRPGLVTGRAPEGRRSATSGLLAAVERAAAGGPRPRMFTDEWRTPVAVQDVAVAVADLLPRRELTGLLHLGGDARLSRLELARTELRQRGLDEGLLDAGTRADAGLEAERPADLSLDSTRLREALGWWPRSVLAD